MSASVVAEEKQIWGDPEKEKSQLEGRSAAFGERTTGWSKVIVVGREDMAIRCSRRKESYSSLEDGLLLTEITGESKIMATSAALHSLSTWCIRIWVPDASGNLVYEGDLGHMIDVWQFNVSSGVRPPFVRAERFRTKRDFRYGPRPM